MQGSKLTYSGTLYLGRAAAISSDGNFGVVGAFYGAYVFTQSNNQWTFQASLLPNDGRHFTAGISVVLNAQGNIALIGDKLYTGRVYTRTGNTWTQIGNHLIPQNPVSYGVVGNTIVSMNAAGTIMAVGGPYDNGDVSF